MFSWLVGASLFFSPLMACVVFFLCFVLAFLCRGDGVSKYFGVNPTVALAVTHGADSHLWISHPN